MNSTSGECQKAGRGPPSLTPTRSGSAIPDHEAAIGSLRAQRLVSECCCTRREILEAPSAPHAPSGAHPGTCRDPTVAGVNQAADGDDLLSSAPRQAHRPHQLGLPEPAYAYVPIALHTAGAPGHARWRGDAAEPSRRRGEQGRVPPDTLHHRGVPRLDTRMYRRRMMRYLRALLTALSSARHAVLSALGTAGAALGRGASAAGRGAVAQIGRASCRERV